MQSKYREFSGLNLPAIEQEILAKWAESQAFEKSVSLRDGAPSFVFYEGPPSANGMPGIHHVISRTLKDLVCRYKTMKGFQVKRKGGWDTHGLPIELGVEKELGITKEDIGIKITVEEYNRKCREAVLRYKDKWDDITRKMGYWVDLDDPYITFRNEYIETLWWLLKELYKKGLLYESVSIQPYSPAAGTGLSSHELNQPGTYKDVKDTSVVAMFKLLRNEKSNFLFAAFPSPQGEGVGGEVYLLAWTTTPWTLPSNLGLTVGPEIDYVLIKTFNQYTHLPIHVVLAKSLLGQYFKPENENADFSEYKNDGKNIPYIIVSEFKGKELEGCRYEQLIPFDANSIEAVREITPGAEPFLVMTDSFVTTEDGTGIVHTAPAFGADDFKVGKKNNIGILTMVDREGKFVDGLGEFSNRFVKNYKDDPTYTDVNVDIAVKLKKENRAFKVEKYEHSYPHCWRTDKPILYYPLDAWFIKTTAVKDRMVELNKTINWKPKSTGEGRFGNWLENMVDWNLSRSRFWGTPLPIWKTEDGSGGSTGFSEQDGEELCIGNIADLQENIHRSDQFYSSEERARYFDEEREIFLAKKAFDWQLANKKDVEFAVCRKDIEGNFIHFLWGEQGEEENHYRKGYGVSKIIAKRSLEGFEPSEILHLLAETMVKGTIKRRFGPVNNQRIEIVYGDFVAFISEFLNKDKYNWLLTGYKLKQETDETSRVDDLADPTHTSPIRTQDDMGAVSEAKLPYFSKNALFRFKTDDLHKPFVDEIFFISPKGKIMQRVPDLIDVWFDSGAMPFAQWGLPDASSNKYGPLSPENFFKYHELASPSPQGEGRGEVPPSPQGEGSGVRSNGQGVRLFPADFIAEGVDQTRGWFYTLHAIAAMLFDSVAYKTCVSNGLVLDRNGNKMSKRLGNVVDPFKTIEDFGADATRWYLVTNASPWDNMKFDLDGIKEVQRKFFGTLYNTYQFFALYANVDGFEFKEAYIPVKERPEIDRWILSSLNTVTKKVTEYMEDYEPTQAGRVIEDFVDEQLSNWYVRLCRRRFWKGEYEQDKICAYQTLYECLETITRLIAPISPFFSDAVFRNLDKMTGRFNAESVHHVDYPVYDSAVIDEMLEERMQMAQDISSLILSLRKKVNIKVRQPLQKVLIPVLTTAMKEQVQKIEELVKAEVNIKEVEYLDPDNTFIRKKIKPNFVALGKKLGHRMKAVSAMLAAFTQEDIARLEKEGQLNLPIEGEPVILQLAETEITSEDIPGWTVASKASLTVALDVTITPELEAEGQAREFVNRIQKIRKDSQFELTDRVEVKVSAANELKASLAQFKDYICAEILADKLEFVNELVDGIEIEINDVMLNVIVLKKG